MAACSRGPVSTMPGSLHNVPAGAGCDECAEHNFEPATKRVQGETDSFGCEYIDFCEYHYKEYTKEVDKPVAGTCDWCKQHSDDLRQHRDFEEGLHGPLYDVCRPCIRKEAAALAEELELFDRDEEERGDGSFDDDHDQHELDHPWPNVVAGELEEEPEPDPVPRVTIRTPEERRAGVELILGKKPVQLDAKGWPFPTRTKP